MSESSGNEKLTIDPGKVIGRPYLFERKDRKSKPYGVHLKLANGKYTRRFFADNAQRMEFVHEHRLGTDLTSFDAAEWQQWLYIKARCARAGITPMELLAHVERVSKVETSNKTIQELFDEFYKSREGRSDDYLLHLKNSIGKLFIGALGGDLAIAEISKADIETWLAGMDVKPVTKANRYKYVRSMLRWAVMRGYLASSPTDKMEAPEVKVSQPGILTVEQAVALFAANKDDAQACAMLALGAFAGLRSSSIERLAPSEIRIAEKQIFLPANKFKTGRNHLIEHAPENLWPWLERADPKAMCEMTRRQFLTVRERAFAKAGITPPHNALRHSFATYKCAIDGSAERASYILGHTNPAEIWQSYKGIATKADAERYFAIVPRMSV